MVENHTGDIRMPVWKAYNQLLEAIQEGDEGLAERIIDIVTKRIRSLKRIRVDSAKRSVGNESLPIPPPVTTSAIATPSTPAKNSVAGAASIRAGSIPSSTSQLTAGPAEPTKTLSSPLPSVSTPTTSPIAMILSSKLPFNISGTPSTFANIHGSCNQVLVDLIRQLEQAKLDKALLYQRINELSKEAGDLRVANKSIPDLENDLREANKKIQEQEEELLGLRATAAGPTQLKADVGGGLEANKIKSLENGSAVGAKRPRTE
ncbi:hypothetical protein BJ508DRAFT_160789 [Ascobolus immersus RN42]|uniref:Uncharacterized protein n=1 Tax=Ascobolus immersus RN42 TaxID=1160509 RepID=A0A3N4I1F3_ASCIM|nr:hypothetical protein BJ508DRAFT_160789 [Ascobolus immersus RN42]